MMAAARDEGEHRMPKNTDDTPREVKFYMVAVEAPHGLFPRPNALQAAHNVRQIDDYNAQLIGEFSRMAQRIGYAPDDYHIEAAKGAPVVYIAGSRVLMKELARTQGRSIKSWTLCPPETPAAPLFRIPQSAGSKAVPAYSN
jgi:hypothetical protein